MKVQFSRRSVRANAGYGDQEYCQRQDEGPFLFGDENVEENVVKFSRFYGHVHRTNSLNFFRVEV